jgi:4'-phosphopantetheinyl transferase
VSGHRELPIKVTPRLNPGEVHLWFLDQGAPADPAWIEVLDASERERVSGMRVPALREAFVAAHALVRTALSVYGGLPADRWRFEVAPAGRPSIVDPPAGLRFSLTHSGRRAAVAVTFGHELGLDLEAVRPVQDPLPLARRFFEASEAAALARLPEVERPAVFAALWTAKEAVLKAQGAGLSAPLDSVIVELDPAGRPGRVQAPGGPWSVHVWVPEPGWSAALATATPRPCVVSAFRATPLCPPVPAPELGPG